MIRMILAINRNSYLTPDTRHLNLDTSMLKNYLKTAWRNILRKKAFSTINIFGLAIGLAIFALISLFVLDELSYDRYNNYADRIYRINTSIKVNGSGFDSWSTPAPMAGVLVKDYPQVEQAVRISGDNTILVKKGDETLIEKHAFFADSTLFSVFTLPMVVGNPATALSGTNSMVISASMVDKYFNTQDVLGKTLQVDNTSLYTITGVIEDTPVQSHLHFNFIKSMAGEESSRSDFWLSNSFNTYVLLRKGVSSVTLDRYLTEMAKKYAEPQVMEVVHSSFSDLEKKGGHFRYTSLPLTQIHLSSPLSSEIEPSGNIEYVYISAIIGLFILLIACINFMNLSTAQSTGRAKEVGVRKVIGSGRGNLIRQFLTESVLTAMVAFVFSLLLVVVLLPLLNQLAGKEISVFSSAYLWMLPAILGIALICGLLAGVYPAFVLSAFDPVEILKGKFVLNIKGFKLRNALVIFQFTTAIVLITATLIIYRQLDYIRHKDLGYDREQVLVINNAWAMGRSHMQTFKQEIVQLPGVVSGSISQNLPTTTSSNWNKNAYSKDATLNASQTRTIVDWAADADYISTLGMEVVKGRTFSEDMSTDSTAIIVNETAAGLLGFKDPLNAKLYSFDEAQNTTAYHIVGVVKDFNAGSLRYSTEPLLIRYSKTGGQFVFRLQGANIQKLIAEIENRYHSFDGMSSQPFIYSFLDEDFNNLYQAELRTGNLFITFAALAIFIACLGLFGLASYSAEQRTKEIGIRKVLGSSVSGIIVLLSRDFIILVGVAILIATPLAWWAMSKWLDNFAYRIDIHWWVFAISGLVAVAIALFAVSFKTIIAAIANPVKSLRSE